MPSAFLLIVAAAYLTSSCSKHEAVQASNSKTAEVPTVAVAKVTTEDLSNGLVLTAEFKPYQEVEVMAKVAGYIKQINVDVGDRVTQGQLLAVLEIPEMADDLKRADAAVTRSQADIPRAQDELRRAESAHNIAHLSFERLSAVAQKKPGLIAQQEIDEAQSRDLMTEAQLAGAKSALNAAQEQVNVNSADTQKVKTLMEYKRVTAPFAGVITKRYADTGAMIQAGTASQTQAMPVVKLSDNSLLRLILPVPESAVPTVHIGQQVEVRVPTLNRSFPGQVKRFTGKVSPATRTMETEVDVQNANLVLMPGMYAEVDLTLAQRNRVLAIPMTAIDANHQVMVVTPANRIEVRKLTTGLESSDKVEVKSGLNEGDLVVVAGRASLQPGEEVKPKLTAMAAVKPHQLPADDGTYHSTFQDFVIDVRYQVTKRRMVLTPFFRAVVPSNGYTYFAHSAVGRDLREYHTGLNFGRRLNPVLPKAYVQARYSYAFVERIQGIAPNRSNVEAQLGYFVSRRLSVIGQGQWMHTWA